MSRTGKIARLPCPLRDELNHRLDNGEPGHCLVEWLNRKPEVARVMEAHFDARPITEQNLAEWRQGGFLDWKRHQEACDWIRSLVSEADAVTDESGIMPLSDRLCSMATLTLGRLIRSFETGTLNDKESRKEFLEILKGLVRLRRDDLEATRMRNHLEAFPPVSARRRRAAATNRS